MGRAGEGVWVGRVRECGWVWVGRVRSVGGMGRGMR